MECLCTISTIINAKKKRTHEYKVSSRQYTTVITGEKTIGKSKYQIIKNSTSIYHTLYDVPSHYLRTE